MKRIILASIVLVASQNIMAWGLSDVTDETTKANDTVKKVDDGAKAAVDNSVKAAEEASDTVKKEVDDGVKTVEKVNDDVKSSVNDGVKSAEEVNSKKGWGIFN